MKDKLKDILFRLSIFGMLFVVPMVNSCGPQPQQTNTEHKGIKLEPSRFGNAQIEDVQIVNTRVLFDGSYRFNIYFVRFKFNGHYYIDNGDYMFHSPDCDCQSSTIEAPSLLSTPFGSSNSSLFDW